MRIFKSKKLRIIFVSIVVLFCCSCTKVNEFKPYTELTETAKPTITSEMRLKVKQQYTLAFSSIVGEVSFVKTILQGINDSAKEWEKRIGSQIDIVSVDAGVLDPMQQVRDLEKLKDEALDGLLVFAGDSSSVSEPIQSWFIDKNVPVVVTDIGINSDEYISFIITDNEKGGALAAEVIAKAIKKGGKVVVFDTGPGNINAKHRADGFTKKAKELGLEVLPKQDVFVDIEKGRELMRSILQSEPDIAGVFSLTVEPAIGAAYALQEAQNKTCKIVTFDINEATLNMIKTSAIEACIIQDPYFMGYEGLNQMMYYLTGQKDKVKKDIPSPITVCTIQNVSEYENNPQVKIK